MIHTCEIQGKGNEPVVFTENPQRLLSLDQSEEVVCHCLTIEEVVYTQEEVPEMIRQCQGSAADLLHEAIRQPPRERAARHLES